MGHLWGRCAWMGRLRRSRGNHSRRNLYRGQAFGFTQAGHRHVGVGREIAAGNEGFACGWLWCCNFAALRGCVRVARAERSGAVARAILAVAVAAVASIAVTGAALAHFAWFGTRVGLCRFVDTDMGLRNAVMGVGALLMLVAIFYLYVQHGQITGIYTTELTHITASGQTLGLAHVVLPHCLQVTG